MMVSGAHVITHDYETDSVEGAEHNRQTHPEWGNHAESNPSSLVPHDAH